MWPTSCLTLEEIAAKSCRLTSHEALYCDLLDEAIEEVARRPMARCVAARSGGWRPTLSLLKRQWAFNLSMGEYWARWRATVDASDECVLSAGDRRGQCEAETRGDEASWLDLWETRFWARAEMLRFDGCGKGEGTAWLSSQPRRWRRQVLAEYYCRAGERVADDRDEGLPGSGLSSEELSVLAENFQGDDCEPVAVYRLNGDVQREYERELTAGEGRVLIEYEETFGGLYGRTEPLQADERAERSTD